MDKPRTSADVLFCGQWINMSAIARTLGWTPQYISMILNGVRECNIRVYIKISGILGLTIDEVLEGIEDRKRMKLEQAKVVLDSYSQRIAEEDQSGVPPLPALRLPQDIRRKA